MKTAKRVISIVLSVVLITCTLPLFLTKVSAEEKKDPVIMVSIGDSYSSGEGIEPFYGQEKAVEDKVQDYDWLAHRSQLSWPGLLTLPGVEGTMAENRDTNWFFVASSGALTDDLTGTQTKDYKVGDLSGSVDLPAQLEVFDNIEYGTVDFVTVTLGGNDVGFTNIVTSAIANTEENLAKDLDKIWAEFEKEGGIRDKLKASYYAIAEKAGSQATIIVAGYPKLVNPEGFTVLSFFKVTPEKAGMLNSAATGFNAEIKKLVEECKSEGLNIVFADVEKEFDGHEAYTEEPYINEVIKQLQPEDINDEQMVSSNSVHPNAEGAKAYARVVQKVIDELVGEKEVVVNVTNKALASAEENLKLYFNGKSLKAKAFMVTGKVDGEKTDVYYVPVETIAKALGGEVTLKNKKVTVKFGKITLTFKQGKNSYVVSYKDENGKKQKKTLQYGRAALKGEIIYIPSAVVEELAGLFEQTLTVKVTKTKFNYKTEQ